MVHQNICLTSAVVCSLLITTSGCAGEPGSESESDLEEHASPVVRGTAATQDQLFSAVALMLPNENKLQCSGTLIAPSVVVTAAHCVIRDDNITEYAPSEFMVVAGVLDARTATTDQQYDVTSITPHVGWVYPLPPDLGKPYDIAILSLERSIRSLSPIPTLPFDQIDSNLSMGTLVTIEGYGYRDFAMTLDGQLHIAQTPYQQRNDTEFLAGDPTSPDTCTGDSGGPVYLTVGGTMYVVGITSRPFGAMICGTGGIYTILSAFESWLQANSGGAYPPANSGAGSSSLIPGCACRVERAAASSEPGSWIGIGIAWLVARCRRRSPQKDWW
jgi:secreted trypsin-like serine protease